VTDLRDLLATTQQNKPREIRGSGTAEGVIFAKEFWAVELILRITWERADDMMKENGSQILFSNFLVWDGMSFQAAEGQEYAKQD
jgi:hypothetical protein